MDIDADSRDTVHAIRRYLLPDCYSFLHSRDILIKLAHSVKFAALRNGQRHFRFCLFRE